ncbi:MAG: PilZ domain-containing protein [Lachnospiraceae bacterium]|nr:PilZ domain-containing protein [Lachnospiraceae bacterium]
MEERRRSTRLGLETNLVIRRIDVTTDQDFVINIIDVSKSGLGFFCHDELPVGSVYEAFLRIWTKEVIHALLEVARVKNKGGGYEYGAFFVGMPEQDASRIEVYTTIEQTTREMNT